MLTIYTAPGCGACTVTKAAARSAGIPFEVVDLSTNPELVDQLRARGHHGLPVVVSDDGQEWAGLDLDRIRALGAA
jgi:glutaredoxin